MIFCAVIGAGFGDEGKGLVTDHLCKNSPNPIVVRYNGGAQAGHTVETEDGKRHVFSHFGAGTFRGAPTYFSEHTIINPLRLAKELVELYDKFKINPSVIIHPSAKVTTPYDEMFNWAIENKRGANRHGSCGMGINATVDRHSRMGLTMFEICHFEKEQLRLTLQVIRDAYYLLEIENQQCEDFLVEDWKSDEVIDNFIDLCSTMKHHCICMDYTALMAYETIVFEGAQGLQLDEINGQFPHVTRSRTGLHNVVQIVDEIKKIEPNYDIIINVNYVTRFYNTRHGAGPLKFEGSIPNIESDNTNVDNHFQGQLRHAPLDLTQMGDFVCRDIHQNSKYHLSKRLIVTWADQIPPEVPVIVDNKLVTLTLDRFVETVHTHCMIQNLTLVYGKTAEDFHTMFRIYPITTQL